ncbi:hypothetical protein EVAR_40100_1 [Eumeta japonica]|uniref:Uncharacterized protein n=1 Tax=Eumeta variegata TaxID=151549 RepID=A0A4C1WBL5_EUMVA|nr:hypothetical protein EVAR_40100_1 [Eumeta japonica]
MLGLRETERDAITRDYIFGVTPTKTKVTRLTSPLPPALRRVARCHLYLYRTRIGRPSYAENAQKRIFNSRKHSVVLRGIPWEIPIEEVKEDLRSQNLRVQSVRRIRNRPCEILDLVLNGLRHSRGQRQADESHLLQNQKRVFPLRNKGGAVMQTRLTWAVSQLPILRTLVETLL